MNRYTGSITFMYYRDFEYGTHFMEEVLLLEKVMDQGFAKVYQVNEKSYVGIVQKKSDTIAGDTLLSFNTLDVEKEYERIQKLDVFRMTEIQLFESIPLRSFFFYDKENHHFEVQEFLKEEDKLNF